MTKREYAQEIANIIGARVEIREVEKTNGIVLTGITKVNEDSNISPTVYVDPYYKDNTPVAEAALLIEKTINEYQKTSNYDTSQITDYENVKEKLRARLYNKKTKADIYRKANGFDDLIIVPYICLNESEFGGYASVKVTDGLLCSWGVDQRTVIDKALRNSAKETSLKNMESVMMAMMFGGESKEIADGEVPEMLVVSNKGSMYGAVSVLLEKEKLQKMYPNGYVVLPSSVHEVIVVPYAPGCEDAFTGMVGEVNATEVKPEEVLGHKAYIFAA